VNKEECTTSKADENAEVIRRGYQAFNTADMNTLTEIMHEDVSWHTPGRSRIAGDYRGRDAVFAQFGRYGGETAGTFKATVQHVVANDDGRVVGIHHNSGERNGKRLDVRCCIEFQVKDGRLMSGRDLAVVQVRLNKRKLRDEDGRKCRSDQSRDLLGVCHHRVRNGQCSLTSETRKQTDTINFP
jgi:uncharacterized protein